MSEKITVSDAREVVRKHKPENIHESGAATGGGGSNTELIRDDNGNYVSNTVTWGFGKTYERASQATLGQGVYRARSKSEHLKGERRSHTSETIIRKVDPRTGEQYIHKSTDPKMQELVGSLALKGIVRGHESEVEERHRLIAAEQEKWRTPRTVS